MSSIYKYEIAENFGYSSNTAEINAWNTDMWHNSFNKIWENDWTKKSFRNFVSFRCGLLRFMARPFREWNV